MRIRNDVQRVPSLDVHAQKTPPKRKSENMVKSVSEIIQFKLRIDWCAVDQAWHIETPTADKPAFADQCIFPQQMHPELLLPIGHHGVLGRMQFMVRQCSLL